MNALHKITRARSALITSQPFFGCLALGLEVEERADIATMATDGRGLYFSPAFVAGLSEPELIGVLAHEVMHNASLHHCRRGNRDPKLWNKAADYAINRDLTAAGFTLPAGALIDPRFGDLGAEAIYSILAKAGAGKPQDGQQGQSSAAGNETGGKPPAGPAGAKENASDPGGCGEVWDAAPGHAPGAVAEAAADWSARVRQAIGVAKAQNAGKVPGELERLVAEMNTARADWRAILRRFVDDSARRDFSWTRPNRRHVAAGVILPGYVPDGLNHLVVAVDTSGSIDADMLAVFGAEVSAAFEEGAADRVTVIYADARVRRVETFEAGETVTLNAKGGGGTDFRDTFAWIEGNAADASAVVYLTDLAVQNFGVEPAAPVLWACSCDPRQFERRAAAAPFGEAVHLTD